MGIEITSNVGRVEKRHFNNYYNTPSPPSLNIDKKSARQKVQNALVSLYCKF